MSIKANTITDHYIRDGILRKSSGIYGSLKKVALFGSIISLTNCGTALKVSNTLNDQPVRGVIYTLPLTQFEVEISRKVVGCQNDQLMIKSDIKIEKKSIDDPAHTYAIDPTSLSHFFNKASSTITFHENTRNLKSFNATVEDETGAAIASIASIAGNILGASLVAPEAPERLQPCLTNATASSLSAVKGQIDVLEGITKNLEDKNLTLARLIAEHAENLPAQDVTLDAKIVRTKKQIKTLLSQSEAEKVLLQRELKKITTTSKIKWPTNGNEMNYNKPIKIDSSTLEQWTGVTPTQATIDKFDVNLSMERLDPRSGSQQNYTSTGARVSNDKGIYYRNPAKGRLVFTNCNQDGSSCYYPHTISQLGHVNVLPVESKPFGSATFAAQFSSDGYLTSAGYTETSSTSTGILAGATAISSQYKTYITDKAEAEQKAKDVQLKKLQTEVSIMEAQQKLNPPPPSADAQALAIINSQTVLANAEIARITAERQLLALQTP